MAASRIVAVSGSAPGGWLARWSATGPAAWDASDVMANTWHVLTKTFNVLTGTWATDTITESLWVEYADPQLPDRFISFNYLYYGVTIEPLADAQSGDPSTTVTYTLHLTNTGNVTDSFDLVAAGNTWTTTVPASAGPGSEMISGRGFIGLLRPQGHDRVEAGGAARRHEARDQAGGQADGDGRDRERRGEEHD